jgi:hypothetical protein
LQILESTFLLGRADVSPVNDDSEPGHAATDKNPMLERSAPDAVKPVAENLDLPWRKLTAFCHFFRFA